MPRGGKRGARGDSQRGGSRDVVETKFIPFASKSSQAHNDFTLADEARNTERHQSDWEADKKLRYSKVTFISAGSLSNTESKDAETALANLTLESPPQQEVEIQVEVEIKDHEKKSQNSRITTNTSSQQADIPTRATSSFFIDTHGSKDVNTGLPSPRIRSPSPSPSNSSEEVILFSGRKNMGKGVSRNSNGSKPTFSSDPFDKKIKILEDQIHEQKSLLEEALDRKISPLPFCGIVMEHPNENSEVFQTVLHGRRNRRRRQHHQGYKGAEKVDEVEIIDDYLANIDPEDRQVLLQAFAVNDRELGGNEDEVWQDETETSSGEPYALNEHLNSDWDASYTEDIDDGRTSDGVKGEVRAIFSKRERKGGLQYLVAWKSQTVDEAQWVPATTLTGVGALAHIEEFEAEEKLATQFPFASDNDDESLDSDDREDRDDTEDDDDLIQRKIDHMDDEQIARLLAKQEELGMGSDQLLLFDDAADTDEEELIFPDPTLNPVILPSKKTCSKRPRGEFSASTCLADTYDRFDVMDFERPSLQKKPKSRKAKLISDDASNSKLKDSMQAALNNDRMKKKERKQEREELRAQGLLGSKNGKPDLKQKYKGGIGIHAVKNEIQRFLMGSNTTLPLPPMDKADRKIVHEIANAFKLKSKSVGKGKSRFPVLYRTQKTTAYVERKFADVEAGLIRRFMPRRDIGWNKAGATKRPDRGVGGFNNAAVSYRDGDVVGGSAPELGAENRGRAMLEKMGWSQGTALGALNNKGILLPVSHVVKTTKAGLG